jgi:hypothetical protein
MTEPKQPSKHLSGLRRRIEYLVTRIERLTRDGGNAKPEQLIATRDIAQHLLRDMDHATQAIQIDHSTIETLAHIDARFREGQARIDAIHQKLEEIQPPKQPDLHAHGKSSGSVVGDSVRDSFLNMS